MLTFNTIEELKSYIKEQLAKTDYAMLDDVKLLNKNEFVIYRSALRHLYFSNDLYVTTLLPGEPHPEWKDPGASLTQEQAVINNITTL